MSETVKLNNDSEVDQTELNKMRGDAIGDTAYSERFVLQTLLHLTKVLGDNTVDEAKNQAVELKEAIETDLCLLWDMSTEKDVAEYLLEVQFAPLAMATFNRNQQPRLTEIMMGIISNMTCHNTVRSELRVSEPLTEAVINVLACSDVPTLKESIRFFKNCLWSPPVGEENTRDLTADIFSKRIHQSEAMWHNLAFILASSLNVDLLKVTVELVEQILAELDFDSSEAFWEQTIGAKEIVEALCEALIQFKQSLVQEASNGGEEVNPDKLHPVGSALSCSYRLYSLEKARVAISDKAQVISEHVEWFLRLLLDIDERTRRVTLSEFCLYEAVFFLDLAAPKYISLESITLCGKLLLRLKDEHNVELLEPGILDFWERVSGSSQASLLPTCLENFPLSKLVRICETIMCGQSCLVVNLHALELGNKLKEAWEIAQKIIKSQ